MDSIWLILYRWLVRYAILFLGLFGSIFGTIVLSRKKMENFPARQIYRFLLIIDAIYLTVQVAADTMDILKFRFRLSNIICKCYIYFNFSVAALSSYALVYISIDRYISIFFKQIKLITKKWFQNLMIFLIFAYNLCFYVPFLLYIELMTDEIYETETNSTTPSFYCDMPRQEFLKILYLSDLINASLVPFVFMFIASIVLIYSIIKSRLRILNLTLEQDKKKLKKDIKFAVTILVLNISFLIFCFPICLANYFYVYLIDDLFYDFFICLFYLEFCTNFYILVLFNSMFRKEFIALLKC